MPSRILITHLACCADDSPDRGSGRIRLSPTALSASGISYHKPVLVTIPWDGSPQPWKLLCITALAPEVEEPQQQSKAPRPQHRRGSQTGPLAPGSAPEPHIHLAVVDPSVVVVPPGAQLSQLREVLFGAAEGKSTTSPADPDSAGRVVSTGTKDAAELAPGTSPRVCAYVTACRGTSVPTATEVQLRVPPGLEHLVSPPTLAFKLHQAMVLPGCSLLLSDTAVVQVESVRPLPAAVDQPLRIVPSTRLLLAGQQTIPCQPPSLTQPLSLGQGHPQPPQAGSSREQEEGQEHASTSSAVPKGGPASRRSSGVQGAKGTSAKCGRRVGAVGSKLEVGEEEQEEPASATTSPCSAAERLRSREGKRFPTSLSAGQPSRKTVHGCGKDVFEEVADGRQEGALGCQRPTHADGGELGESIASAEMADGVSVAIREGSAASEGSSKKKKKGGLRVGVEAGTEAAGITKANSGGGSAAEAGKPSKGKVKEKSGKGGAKKGGGITASASAFDALLGLTDE